MKILIICIVAGFLAAKPIEAQGFELHCYDICYTSCMMVNTATFCKPSCVDRCNHIKPDCLPTCFLACRTTGMDPVNCMVTCEKRCQK